MQDPIITTNKTLISKADEIDAFKKIAIETFEILGSKEIMRRDYYGFTFEDAIITVFKKQGDKLKDIWK